MKRHRAGIKPTCLVLLSAALGLVDQLGAQPCLGDRDRPAVCTVELYAGADGARPQKVATDEPISLAVGGRLELTVDAFDQFNRRFPAERLAVGHQLDDRCRGLLTVRELQTGRFEVNAASSSGTCRMWLWIPGNLNLEWPLEMEVVAKASQGRTDSYTRSQSEVLATCLYRGLLGREPDPAGLRDTVADIERGKLSERVRTITNSREYANTNHGKSAGALITQLYTGILDRQPDAAGMANFLTRVQRGGIDSVTLELVRSEEFERRVIGTN